MKKPIRYGLYVLIGFIIYQVINSGETSFTHEDAKKTLIIGMAVVFILLLLVRTMKNRYDKGNEE
ncbi:MAG: hypothetical protein AB8B73_10440 [Ekhidna sp.]